MRSPTLTITASATLLGTEFEGGAAFPPSLDELPVTPDFKANLIARYEFVCFGLPAFAQGALVHSGDSGIDLRADEAALIGRLPSYTLVDLSTGFDTESWKLDFYINNVADERAALGRLTQCAIATCAGQPYDIPSQPRTYGIRFGQRF